MAQKVEGLPMRHDKLSSILRNHTKVEEDNQGPKAVL